jgi:hypothetical protein
MGAETGSQRRDAYNTLERRPRIEARVLAREPRLAELKAICQSKGLKFGLAWRSQKSSTLPLRRGAIINGYTCHLLNARKTNRGYIRLRYFIDYDVDFMVLCIRPGLWMIFPRDEYPEKNTTFSLKLKMNMVRSGFRRDYRNYVNAWDLLRRPHATKRARG